MFSLYRIKQKQYLLALLPFALLALLFEAIPLIMIVIRSFLPEGELGFTLIHYQSIFTKRLYQQAILHSVVISIASSLIGLSVAFFGAKSANRMRGRSKTIYMSILNMTSNFAGIPLAFAYIIMLGSVGVFVMIGKEMGIGALGNFDLYTTFGLIVTYVYFQIPLATLLMVSPFEGIKACWIEAVGLLGGSRLDFWRKVGIPFLFPALLGTLSVLFANALAAYATAYALLQNNFSLLPIRVSEQFVGDVVQRKEFGSALAVVMMLLMVVAIGINQRMIRKMGVKES